MENKVGKQILTPRVTWNTRELLFSLMSLKQELHLISQFQEVVDQLLHFPLIIYFPHWNFNASWMQEGVH